jgi:hypothetical protein
VGCLTCFLVQRKPAKCTTPKAKHFQPADYFSNNASYLSAITPDATNIQAYPACLTSTVNPICSALLANSAADRKAVVIYAIE